MTIDAIYADGVFTPISPVGPNALPENQRVRLTVEPNPNSISADWIRELGEYHIELERKYGVFPDSTEIIRADRCRDA